MRARRDPEGGRREGDGTPEEEVLPASPLQEGTNKTTRQRDLLEEDRAARGAPADLRRQAVTTLHHAAIPVHPSMRGRRHGEEARRRRGAVWFPREHTGGREGHSLSGRRVPVPTGTPAPLLTTAHTSVRGLLPNTATAAWGSTLTRKPRDTQKARGTDQQTPTQNQTKPASQARDFSMARALRTQEDHRGTGAGFPACPSSVGPESDSQHRAPSVSPLPFASGLVTVSHADWLASPI